MNCGIINFATAEVCRKCQLPATGDNPANAYARSNFQQQNPPSSFPANHFAPQENHHAGSSSEALQPPPTNQYSQNNGYPQTGYSNSHSQPLNYPQNNYAQGNSYQNVNPAPGYNPSQSGSYDNPNPYGQNPNYAQPQNPAPPNANNYAQNNGFQQNNGYAYNRDNSNGLNPQGQGYTNYPQANSSQSNYSQTDYSQAPSYGGPAMASYQPMGYGGQAAGVWRDGKKLVMHKQAFLPDRCVKCNTPTNGAYLHRKLSWLHPACKITILFGLIGWIIYAILSSALKKKAEVDVGLCEQHTGSRKTNMTIGWAMVIFGVVLTVIAFSTETGAMILLGIVLIIAGAIIASLAYGVVTVTKMDDNYVWMSRVNQDYLSNFPSSNGF
jgi:hypothetical protein